MDESTVDPLKQGLLSAVDRVYRVLDEEVLLLAQGRSYGFSLGLTPAFKLALAERHGDRGAAIAANCATIADSSACQAPISWWAKLLTIDRQMTSRVHGDGPAAVHSDGDWLMVATMFACAIVFAALVWASPRPQPWFAFMGLILAIIAFMMASPSPAAWLRNGFRQTLSAQGYKGALPKRLVGASRGAIVFLLTLVICGSALQLDAMLQLRQRIAEANADFDNYTSFMKVFDTADAKATSCDTLRATVKTYDPRSPTGVVIKSALTRSLWSRHCIADAELFSAAGAFSATVASQPSLYPWALSRERELYRGMSQDLLITRKKFCLLSGTRDNPNNVMALTNRCASIPGADQVLLAP